jgi:hypothetical protein
MFRGLIEATIPMGEIHLPRTALSLNLVARLIIPAGGRKAIEMRLPCNSAA